MNEFANPNPAGSLLAHIVHVYMYTCMWQSRTENKHYSISMKIEFKAENITIYRTLCVRISSAGAVVRPRDDI